MSAGEPQVRRDSLAMLRIPRREEPPRPSLSGRILKGSVIVGIGLAIVGGGLALARHYGWLGPISQYVDVGEFVPEAIRSVPEVRVASVVVEKGRSGDALVAATGYLESRRQAMIGARAAGRIESVNVEEGSRVTAGEILAVLEHKDLDASLAAAKATLSQAIAQLAEQDVEIARTQTDLKRLTKLRSQNTVTEAEHDRARFAHEAAVARRESLKAAVELAESRVQEAEQLTENMLVRAPFDGTVISKDAEVGESILPGGMGEASGRGSVVTIADLEHLEVDCDVKEDYISRVNPGAPAEVAVDAVPDRRYRGRVRKIIPMGDRARATIKVKVEILDADERLFPDMSSTVYILPDAGEEESQSEAPRMFCPSDALQSEGDGTFVWLLNSENRAEQISVTAGAERDGRVEILNGLSGGERVILNPPPNIAAGMLLKAR